jgi:hypothetical protein
MDYVVLAMIAGCLGAGVAGGVLVSWGCHRRLLALEQNLKIILVAYDDRLNQLTKIAVRQDKTEAAKARWSKKETQDEQLAMALTGKPGNSMVELPPHAWDPRTWGESK